MLPMKRLLTAVPVACLLFCTGAMAQKKKETVQQQLNLFFNPKAGNTGLVPGQTYTNAFGEQYTVKTFRFYIGQIELRDSTNSTTQYFPDDYYLVDAGDTSTQRITIPVSLDHVTSITFLVGVDSATNTTGTQQGALDPANGMFWTWNSGYIMMKLQGTSPAAQVPANAFTLDIGGYKPGEKAARTLGFYIKHPLKTQVHNIVFNVDVNKLFNGEHNVKLAEHPMCHEPGTLAMQLADNFNAMFSIGQVTK